MSAADATGGHAFGADLAVAGRRARIPDALLSPVTGLIWLVAEGVIFIAGVYPFFAFHLLGAALVYLDSRRDSKATLP